MQIRQQRISLLGLAIILNGCANPYPDDFYRRSQSPGVAANGSGPVSSRTAEQLKPSRASTLDSYKRELAQQISQQNSQYVYSENPQAMLRAVIVLHFVLDAEGRLLKSDIVRSNSDRYAEQLALRTLRGSAPFARPNRALLVAGRLDVSETWLFNDDGRFQLRSIALPQNSE